MPLAEVFAERLARKSISEALLHLEMARQIIRELAADSQSSVTMTRHMRDMTTIEDAQKRLTQVDGLYGG